MSPAACAWEVASSPPLLGPDEVHIWFARLVAPPATVAALARLLSAEERARAERFRFPHLRDRYLVGRSLLRVLIAGYTGRDASALAIGYNAYGKPHLNQDTGAGRLCFNVTHSQEVILIGLTRDRAIGVDVEHLRDVHGMDLIAERLFSARERVMLRSLPAAARRRGFFNAWTR